MLFKQSPEPCQDLTAKNLATMQQTTSLVCITNAANLGRSIDNETLEKRIRLIKMGLIFLKT
jgi:hypothetical protein